MLKASYFFLIIMKLKHKDLDSFVKDMVIFIFIWI